MPTLKIDTYNLAAIERQVCIAALEETGSLQDAAPLLGITRHALKRRIEKHRIDFRRGFFVAGTRGRVEEG